MLTGFAAALAVLQCIGCGAAGPAPSGTPTTSAAPDTVRVALPTPPADTGVTLAEADSALAPLAATGLVPANIAGDTGTISRRPRAIEYSDAYYTRLEIHRIGAYAMLPLFATEYVLGQSLLNSTNRSSGLKTAHGIVAGAVGVVFASNTITGAWNWWEARHDPNDRTRRTIHSVVMLASDVGFLWTAASAGGAKRRLSQARTHKMIALGSISLSTLGAAMMWIWKK